MAGKAKKVTKTIREQLADLKRQQRERMKAAGETPQSLRKKRDRRRAEANRLHRSNVSAHLYSILLYTMDFESGNILAAFTRKDIGFKG